MIDYVPISEEQLTQFDEEGYLIIRQAVDDQTISGLIEAGDRLIASDHLANRQRHEDGRDDGFRNCITLDDAYVPFLTHQTILALVIQLLGTNLQSLVSEEQP